MNLFFAFQHLSFLFIVIQKVLETIGVFIIITGTLYAIFVYGKTLLNKADKEQAYTTFRVSVAKSTIAGLEVMVAADVINTVHDLDFYQLGLILLLVIIRTILNYSLTKELNV